MATQDTTQLKQNIISIIQNKGPSLPIHIAKGTGLIMLFASAFLSELLSEKRIKISHLRVGSSPIYYLSGQEPQLERYSNNPNEKFFDVIKEYLLKKQIEITGIEGFSKDDLILKVKKENAEFLLIAYSKKRIGEEEITKALNNKK